jgi:hypothetical protein
MAGMKALSRAEVTAIGGYNAFLRTTLPPEHRIYDPDKETLESGMATFLTAFPRGFAIEVLDVYSGPPRIAFKFRSRTTLPMASASSSSESASST